MVISFSILGAVFGSLIYYIGYHSGSATVSEMGLVVVISCIIYLALLRWLNKPRYSYTPHNHNLFLILNIIYITTISFSIYLSHVNLFRPESYFVLLSICAATLGLEIMLTAEKVSVYFLLIKVLIFAFVLRSGVYYELPGYPGYDAWLHAATVDDWLRNSHISGYVSTIPTGYTGYVYFPVMHIIVGLFALLAGTTIYNSMFLSVGLISILTIIFIYYSANSFMDRQSALLASLVIAISQPTTNLGTLTIPTLLGLSYFTILLGLTFKSHHSSLFIILYIFISGILVTTHTISAFIASIALLTLLISNKYIFKYSSPILRSGVGLAFIIFLMTIAYWKFVFYYPNATFFNSVTGWLSDAITLDTRIVGTITPTESDTILNRVWFLLLIIFVIIGILSWLISNDKQNIKIPIIITLIDLALLTFIPPIFNINSLIPGRWVAFIIVIGSYVIANGILSLTYIINNNIIKSIIIFSIIAIYTFFSINNSIINPHTPFFQKPIRYSFYESEISAVETLYNITPNLIMSDNTYIMLLVKPKLDKTNLIDIKPGEEYKNGLIVIRKAVEENNTLIFDANYNADNITSYIKYISDTYQYIYNNGEIYGYTYKK